MVKYVVFDFDGTLVESRNLAIQIFNEFSEKYGYKKIEKHEIDRYSKMTTMERIRALQMPLHRVPIMLYDAKKRYKQLVLELKLVYGMNEVIGQLKDRGIIMGILSSNSEENIRYFLETNNIHSIDFVYSASNLFGKDKAIRKMLKNVGIKKTELLYIGDEIRDIEACRKVNIQSMAVTWGFDDKELITKRNPDRIVSQPFDILEHMPSKTG